MRELVMSTFDVAWRAAQPDVPLVLENEARPTSGQFVMLTIVPTSSQQMTQGRRGNRRVMRNVWLRVKLWGPVDEGSTGLAALGDAVQIILEMVSLPSPVAGDEPLTTLAAQSGPSGTDGRWSMGLISISAWYAETK